MHLSEKAIAEFKAIWKKEFKEEISDEMAKKRGMELVEFYRLLIKNKKTTRKK